MEHITLVVVAVVAVFDSFLICVWSAVFLLVERQDLFENSNLRIEFIFY